MPSSISLSARCADGGAAAPDGFVRSSGIVPGHGLSFSCRMPAMPARSDAEDALVAAEICRGTMRTLLALDHVAVAEVPLANGRRADLAAVDRAGGIVIVEVKSSRTDFMTDRKWPDYLGFCDRFYFAVGVGFPEAILPPEEGLIVADRYAAEVARPPQHRPLPAARRKAMLIRIARLAALRLHGVLDPDLDLARFD
jgi:hypothetical protein